MPLQRFKHNLSHYHLTTLDMGQLVPVACVEVLPGDTLAHAVSVMLRVTPLVRPVMHPVHVKVHCWFVPNRLVYSGWEDFITQANPAETIPTLTLTGSNEDLIDRLGPPVTAGLEISALPVRAYNLIYNEFYRDQNLVSAVSLDQKTLLRAAWEKDYFTTARATPQQGTESIVSFGAGEAPITGLYTDDQGASVSKRPISGTSVGALDPDDYSNVQVQRVNQTAGGDLQFPVVADLANATGGFSIPDFWAAEAAQRWAMRRNRFGSRYVDFLAALGVNAGDARLQRPEYLGGGKQTIAFSEVLSTADTTGSSGQVVGDLAGHGIAALRTRRYRYFAKEHGYMLALMTVRPKTIYMDAVHRTWLRREYSDWWQKEFEILAEQGITETELYGPGGNTTNVFGYQQVHQDYRFQPSFVSGDFRQSTSDDWHYGRQFMSAPTLNGSFVTCTPTDRVYADTGEPEIYSMIHHSLVARRLVRRFARNP